MVPDDHDSSVDRQDGEAGQCVAVGQRRWMRCRCHEVGWRPYPNRNITGFGVPYPQCVISLLRGVLRLKFSCSRCYFAHRKILGSCRPTYSIGMPTRCKCTVFGAVVNNEMHYTPPPLAEHLFIMLVMDTHGLLLNNQHDNTVGGEPLPIKR